MTKREEVFEVLVKAVEESHKQFAEIAEKLQKENPEVNICFFFAATAEDNEKISVRSVGEVNELVKKVLIADIEGKISGTE